MKTNKIFCEYGNNPVELFKRWLSEAEASEPVDPNAMAVATADRQGRASVRLVLLRSIDADGLVFFTNYEGKKARDLAENPYAEANFYWKSLSRQIRIAGPVQKVSAADSDAYFATRARGKQIGAWASAQSEAFEDYEELELKACAIEERFAGQEIPRPPHWGGYRIGLERMEFWIAEQDRLHTRFVYTAAKNGTWQAHWLFP